MSDWENDAERIKRECIAQLDANEQAIRERRAALGGRLHPNRRKYLHNAVRDRLRTAKASQRRHRGALTVWWVNTWIRQTLWRIRND